ncbi:MAG TPA: cobyrinate a,c-diamide synthase [Burkholderiaceae bacterium]|nr:cobyrinate a,c-diamide synthase [Burkholderiaceae bacterium]
MKIARLLVSAAHKSSGKTTIALGLCAAFTAQGLRVQPFKKGPDYIDPMWLARAARRDCFNLDAYLMQDETLAHCFGAALVDADLAIVEGNKGLYDGLALDGSNSNAALAMRLRLPVLLVLDARGMTRGIAPLILGYQAFEPGIRIGGVILNRLGGSRHEAKLRAVIEHYTDVPVLGAVAEDERLALTERHLGLMPCAEVDDVAARIDAIGRAVAAQVDLQRVRALAASADDWGGESGATADGGGTRVVAPLRAPPARHGASRGRVLRIAIARDRAFGFYYPDDLRALEAAGAQLVAFDTLHDAALPPAIDGLFIGGGFPETCLDALQANVALRAAIRDALAAGLPAYAECGGLMYLARSITWRGRTAQMVGAIPGDAVMHDRPQGRGYVHLRETAAMPWPAAGPGPAHGAALRCHEFHHSSLANLDPDVAFAYRVERGHGIDGENDGIVRGNLLASYAHLRSAGGTHWAPRFIAFARAWRDRRPARSKPAQMHAA